MGLPLSFPSHETTNLAQLSKGKNKALFKVYYKSVYTLFVLHLVV